MKKFISIIITAAVFISCIYGCDFQNSRNKRSLSVVTTIFPEYEWVSQIVRGTDTDVTLLLDNGVDLHSYQPTAEDILKISDCGLFIYVGGESDKWVEDVLKKAANRDMKVLNLLDILGGGAKKEEIKNGMQAEEDASEDSGEEAEYDEHVWLSLKNAQVFSLVIAQALSEIDSANDKIYKANADNYIQKLADLDKDYEAAVEQASVKTLLFGDRFPFRYLADDYGLDYYAAFAGCSAETEASFETILFLANKVDELELGSIMRIEGSDGKIAETIKQNTKAKTQQILTLNSIQSETLKDVENGAAYLSIMQENLDVIKDALK